MNNLDRAIDHVASRLTRMKEDPQMALRIANALPERGSWFGWVYGSWVVRVAAIAIVIGGGMLLTRRAVMPIASLSHPAVLAPLAAAVHPTSIATAASAPRERLNPVTPVNPVNPVDLLTPVAPLVIGALAPSELALEASIDVAPLAIDDLPLTIESFSPR